MNTIHATHVATEVPALIGQRIVRVLASVLHRSGPTRRTQGSTEPTPRENLVPYHVEPSPGDLLIQCVRGQVSVDPYGDCYLNGRPFNAKAARESDLRYEMAMEATKIL